MKWFLYFSVLIFFACQTKDKPRKSNSTEVSKRRDPAISVLKKKLNSKLANQRELSRKFPFYEGSTTLPQVKPGDMVWGPVPLSDGWDIVNYGICRISAITESMVKCNAGNLSFWVPGAILVKVENKGKIKKNQLVLASIGLSSEWGTVVRSRSKNSTVRLYIGSGEKIRELPNEFLRSFKNKVPVHGYPVFYKKRGRWFNGALLSKWAGGNYVIGFGGQIIKVDRSNLILLDFKKKYNKGAWIWAPYMDALEEARIIRVMYGGAFFQVEFSGRNKISGHNPRYLRLTQITSPLG
ncbi:MAG: hypothetical protein JXR95_16690 [Deltaproteobacteria bacterium]|nr:hypothetical protein [Deltaproteobacteria bacterium]